MQHPGFPDKIGMDNGKGYQGGIQGNDNSKDMDKGIFFRILGVEAEYPIKAENSRHKSPKILADHF
jgi:hypothetical protein